MCTENAFCFVGFRGSGGLTSFGDSWWAEEGRFVHSTTLRTALRFTPASGRMEASATRLFVAGSETLPFRGLVKISATVSAAASECTGENDSVETNGGFSPWVRMP